METSSNPVTPITSYKVSSADNTQISKWCDRWNKRALKAGVTKTKMFAKLVERQNVVRGSYSITLLQIGKPTQTHSFRGLKLEDISEEQMRAATVGLMKNAGITTIFDY